MFAPISIDLTTPADHELHAQRTAEAKALIEQLTPELEAAKDADLKAIEDAIETDPRLDLEMLDEGCYCHHPTTMAPCGYCESISEEVFEAREALHYAQDALQAAEKQLVEADKIIAPTLLPILIVAEPFVGCEGTTTDYWFGAFDFGVTSRNCTNRATWRVKVCSYKDTTFRHVCDHCLQDKHSGWGTPKTAPIYASSRDKRAGTMSCADRIRAQHATQQLLASGGGKRQTNPIVPGRVFTEDLAVSVADGATTPGQALGGALNRNEFYTGG